MITRYNRISLAAGIPGLILQIVGVFWVQSTPNPTPISRLVLLLGTVLLLVGFAYYAKAKGRSAWWCLMGFLSWIGLIVLAMLKDRSGTTETER